MQTSKIYYHNIYRSIGNCRKLEFFLISDYLKDIQFDLDLIFSNIVSRINVGETDKYKRFFKVLDEYLKENYEQVSKYNLAPYFLLASTNPVLSQFVRPDIRDIVANAYKSFCKCQGTCSSTGIKYKLDLLGVNEKTGPRTVEARYGRWCIEEEINPYDFPELSVFHKRSPINGKNFVYIALNIHGYSALSINSFSTESCFTTKIAKVALRNDLNENYVKMINDHFNNPKKLKVNTRIWSRYYEIEYEKLSPSLGSYFNFCNKEITKLYKKESGK